MCQRIDDAGAGLAPFLRREEGNHDLNHLHKARCRMSYSILTSEVRGSCRQTANGKSAETNLERRAISWHDDLEP